MITGINRELLSFICGLIGLLICHFVIKKNNYRWENNEKYIPIAARKAEPPTEQEMEYQLVINGENKG